MTRNYRKTRRAELEEETRLKIIEAMVALHGSIGPARTTIRAVADRAGVQRATVYRHFPDEASMFAACSAHWAESNPFPDHSAWNAIRGRKRRMHTALTEMYAFFGRNETMLANVFRDGSVLESLGPAVNALRNYLAAAADVLAAGCRKKAGDPALLRAAIGHALSFSTWASLTRAQGLSLEDAVALMAGMIERQAGMSG